MSKDSREAAKSSAGTALRMARAERMTARDAAKSAALTPQSKPKKDNP